MSSKLRMVIAVRHGQDSGVCLSEYGLAQVERLRDSIRDLLPAGAKIAILSSEYGRAVQTADMLGEAFHVKPSTLKILCKDDFDYGDRMRAGLIENVNGVDVIIAVTHFSAPAGIANSFSRSVGGQGIGYHETKKGCGLMVDMTNGAISRINPPQPS